jgi:hypothetical protein
VNVRAIAAHPLTPWAVALVLLAGAAFFWNREKRLRGTAEAAAEAAQLALKQQIVEEQSSKAELRDTVKDLVGQNELLREAYEKAVAAAPDAKPESASRLETGPLPVRAQAAHPPPVPATSTPPACALTVDDKVSLSVDVLELKTSKGNTLIVGTASAYREGPPRTLLAEGKFQSSLSTTHELSEPAPKRWGAMALAACGMSGCGPGVGVLLPPWTVPLVGWRVEAFAGAIAAPGASLAIAGIGARF